MPSTMRSKPLNANSKVLAEWKAWLESMNPPPGQPKPPQTNAELLRKHMRETHRA